MDLLEILGFLKPRRSDSGKGFCHIWIPSPDAGPYLEAWRVTIQGKENIRFSILGSEWAKFKKKSESSSAGGARAISSGDQWVIPL
jgi:hypothetical protein